MESGKGVWNGDTQLYDSDLQTLRQEYDSRKSEVDRGCALMDEASMQTWTETVLGHLAEDNAFLVAGHEKAVSTYQSKFSKQLANDKLMQLNWAIVEFVQLLHKCQGFIDRTKTCSRQDWAVFRDSLRELFQDYDTYLSNLFKKRRTPATHILVIMISEERRNKKPYATPIQYIPCQTLRDQTVRDLLKVVKAKLTEKGITCVGKLIWKKVQFINNEWLPNTKLQIVTVFSWQVQHVH